MLLQLRAAGACALGLVLLSAVPTAATDNAIYACINREGDVRLVRASEPCRRNETRLRLIGTAAPQGTQGPQGPQGPAGPKGPAGPAGPQGAPGPAGQQGPQGTAGAQGVTGSQGAKGDGFAYRGTYDPNQTYELNDVVYFGGSAYLATAPVVGAPGTNSAWTLLVEKGDPGATGPAGAIGPAGPPGPSGLKGDKGDKGDKGNKGDTGATGAPGANGSSVTVTNAPTTICPNGGAAIADASSSTQYVCDGKPGAQGPQGATGTVVVLAQTWVNTAGSSFPAVSCSNPSCVTGPTMTVPNSSFTATTGSGQLLIEATIPIVPVTSSRIVCQPNIDGNWAGSTLPGAGNAMFDYFSQVNTSSMGNVTIARVYPSPGAGTHTFSLACGGAPFANSPSMQFGGVVSFTVLELR